MSQHRPLIIHARQSVRRMTRDPVTQLLLANSQLTLAQLESLLAASVSGEVDLNKALRPLYRPSRRNLSRGAFNRTLIQAENNVIRSIYTVLLLGYLGLYDSPSLQPFVELSDTMRSYINETRQRNVQDKTILRDLNARLVEGISSLAKRHSFKDKL